MILSAAFAALAQIFTPPFRRVFWKTLGLTLLLLVLVFAGAETALAHFLVLPYHWLATSLTLLAAVALLVGFAFAITPVSFLVAGFFFDELAASLKRTSTRSIRAARRPLASKSGSLSCLLCWRSPSISWRWRSCWCQASMR